MAPMGVVGQNPPSSQTPPPPPEPPKDQWADLPKYQDANAKLGPPAAGEKRIVFYGDSITELWAGNTFFSGKGYINRGISSQTSMQLLVRFRQDVIRLHPAVVLILGGASDLAENQGPTSLQAIEDNLQSMAELAKANSITPILCSLLPAFDYPWHKGLNPPPKISAVNAWIRDYCTQNHLIYLDYYSAMVDGRPGMREGLSGDGVHPNDTGHAIMEPMAADAILKALDGH